MTKRQRNNYRFITVEDPANKGAGTAIVLNDKGFSINVGDEVMMQWKEGDHYRAVRVTKRSDINSYGLVSSWVISHTANQFPVADIPMTDPLPSPLLSRASDQIEKAIQELGAALTNLNFKRMI